MSYIHQYFSQCIADAASHLKLNPDKKEVSLRFREWIAGTNNLEQLFVAMKKVTELSKLGIKLHQVYQFLADGKIDFFTVSEKIKEHSGLISKDLSAFLDLVHGNDFLRVAQKTEALVPAVSPPPAESPTVVLFTSPATQTPAEERRAEVEQNRKEKENLILEEDTSGGEFEFQRFEETVMASVKPLDGFLKRLPQEQVHHDEFTPFINQFRRNAELSVKVGFEIVAEMHKTILKTLILLKKRDLMPGKEVIEALRACLIVIVALVKNKEVDITQYHTRAEEFSKKIKHHSV